MPTITNVDGTWVNDAAVDYDAGELRRADASAFAGRGDNYGAAGGIVCHSANSLLVSVDGADLVTVQPGSVVIPGSAVIGTGVYRAGIAAAASASLAARDGANPRVDLVVFRQLDTDVVGSHGAYTSRIEIITGVPSVTPGVPALPSMAVELARINVPASGGGAASVNLTRRQFATGLGGAMLVPTKAALPAAAAPYQRAIALDTGLDYIFDPTVSDWDGDWEDLVSTRDVARYRRIGPSMVVVQINDTGAYETNHNYTVGSGIPARLRPDVPARGGAYFETYPGVIAVNTDGTVDAEHHTGADRANVSATIVYSLG